MYGRPVRCDHDRDTTEPYFQMPCVSKTSTLAASNAGSRSGAYPHRRNEDLYVCTTSGSHLFTSEWVYSSTTLNTATAPLARCNDCANLRTLSYSPPALRETESTRQPIFIGKAKS